MSMILLVLDNHVTCMAVLTSPMACEDCSPYPVTSDDMPDVKNLAMSPKLNDAAMQIHSTSTIIHSAAKIVVHVGGFWALHTGDMIFIGTSPGIGVDMTSPRFLTARDIGEAKIDGWGSLRQKGDAFGV